MKNIKQLKLLPIALILFLIFWLAFVSVSIFICNILGVNLFNQKENEIQKFSFFITNSSLESTYLDANVFISDMATRQIKRSVLPELSGFRFYKTPITGKFSSSEVALKYLEEQGRNDDSLEIQLDKCSLERLNITGQPEGTKSYNCDFTFVMNGEYFTREVYFYSDLINSSDLSNINRISYQTGKILQQVGIEQLFLSEDLKEVDMAIAMNFITNAFVGAAKEMRELNENNYKVAMSWTVDSEASQ